MADIKIQISGTVTIGKMFDIHDNQTVVNNVTVPGGEEPTGTKKTGGEEPTGTKETGVIPTECAKAIDRVLTNQFWAKPPKAMSGKQQFNSRVAIRNAAAVIDLGSGAAIALLMAVGSGLGAVKPGAEPTAFVRALIGLGLVRYGDEKAVRRLANGVAIKAKTLVPEYSKWGIAKDRETGERIHEAMTRPDVH